MRRADRLFQIVLLLRHRRFMTAAQLGSELSVSVRTIYRDIRDMSLSGVPVLGEAGVGYMLDKQFDLPPLMFDRDEIEALTLGARMVSAWGGSTLSAAARRVLAKVDGVLPDELRPEIEASTLFAPDFHISRKVRERTDLLRKALREKQWVSFEYTKADGCHSSRRVQPLGLFFWGSTWSLAAWCEWRRDFRNFRLDRMHRVETQQETFESLDGHTLDDYIKCLDERKNGK